MQWFKHLKIGRRLIIGFLLVASLSVVIGVIGLRNMSLIADKGQRMYEHELMGLSHAREGEVHMLEAGRSIRNAMLTTSEQDRAQFLAKYKARLSEMQSELNAARPLFVSEKGKATFSQLDVKAAEFMALASKIQETVAGEKVSSDQSHEASRALLFGSYRDTVNALEESINSLGALKQANAKEANEENHTLYVESRLFVLISVVVALAAGTLLGWWITRSITIPIQDAVKIAETVAAGDLTSRIEVSGKDETAQLLLALKNMNARLVDVVSQVRRSSDSIATGSTQIAAGNIDLSQRTEEQASNLQETAASMEELTSTVKTNADTADQASQLANAAASAANTGGEVVGKVVHTMQEITQSSSKIADIIGVIDGIAFQTNILALNAAVEAARAGEQGRGFAVVASEVRTLAQRSAGAAKEIKDLISESVEKVDVGSREVNAARAAMEEIVNQVNRVTRLITEISNATKEQSSGISQVGEAVNQLDQVTQQNAALVEESAAAADSLKQQAAMLAELVDVFKLANTDAGHSLEGLRARAPATSAAVKATPAPTTMTHERPPRTPDRNSSRGALKEPASAREASSDWTAF